MSRKFKLAFAGIVVLQVAVLLGFVGYKESTLRFGKTVLLQTVPVDPRDLFRGDYVVLRYEVSSVINYGEFQPGDTVYLPLYLDVRDGGTVSDGGTVWKAQRYASSRPEPDWEVFLKGTVGGSTGAGPSGDPISEVEYGIEQYFVPEGTGHEIETADDVKVEVAVDGFGRAVIKRLIVDGKPWQPG